MSGTSARGDFPSGIDIPVRPAWFRFAFKQSVGVHFASRREEAVMGIRTREIA